MAASAVEPVNRLAALGLAAVPALAGLVPPRTNADESTIEPRILRRINKMHPPKVSQSLFINDISINMKSDSQRQSLTDRPVI